MDVMKKTLLFLFFTVLFLGACNFPRPTPVVPTPTPRPPTAMFKSTPLVTPTDTVTPMDTAESFCPGAPPPRLEVDALAQVTFSDGIPLRVRSSPEVHSDNVITRISDGTRFIIRSEPVCVIEPEGGNAFVFWPIRIEDSDLIGWVAEGDFENYYIERLP